LPDFFQTHISIFFSPVSCVSFKRERCEFAVDLFSPLVPLSRVFTSVWSYFSLKRIYNVICYVTPSSQEFCQIRKLFKYADTCIASWKVSRVTRTCRENHSAEISNFSIGIIELQINRKLVASFSETLCIMRGTVQHQKSMN